MNELSGAYGSPPTPERVEELVTGQLDHADSLVAQLPWSRHRESNQRFVSWLVDGCVPKEGRWPTPPPGASAS